MSKKQLTPNQLKRVKKDWERTSQESIKIEQINDAIYGYGSELACLRIEHKYNSPKVGAGYSVNRKSWFVELER
jgi:hypothetical protein